jgi:hypothetical protein
MTDNTSSSMRLNSSKHAHAPEEARPCDSDATSHECERHDNEHSGNNTRRNRTTSVEIHKNTNRNNDTTTHLEELGHGEVVEAVGAVEDDALDGDGLGQVLHRLRLARASGPGRGSTVHQRHSAHERAVAAVRQRRDHEARRVAEVLVAVALLRVDDARYEVVRVVAVAVVVVGRVLPVVPQLRHPLEVAGAIRLERQRQRQRRYTPWACKSSSTDTAQRA